MTNREKWMGGPAWTGRGRIVRRKKANALREKVRSVIAEEKKGRLFLKHG